jgi:hypothetical protein
LLFPSSSGVKLAHSTCEKTLSFSLKFLLDPNFAPLFWKLLVSECLLGVFAILHCSVSAPPARIVPPQDVHRLLMSAGMITCSDLGIFSSVAFYKTLDFILLYYYYYYYYYYMFIFLIFICMYPILLLLLLLLLHFVLLLYLPN